MSAGMSLRHGLAAVLVFLALAAGDGRLVSAQVEGSRIGGGQRLNPIIDPNEGAAAYLRATPLQRSAALSREVKEIRIAQQFGLGYLPLMVARQYGMIEKHASAAGLGRITVRWSRFPSGKDMNAALRAGFLDMAAGGVAPLLEVWDQTRGGREVKGIMSLCSMPLFLNTTNPQVRNLADFGARDRIALPAVRVSGQAVILQMAVAQVFGAAQANRLDPITLSLSHPEAMEALLEGKAGVTAHFAAPPYQNQELKDPRVRKVLSSYSILGGPSTFSALWTSSRFYEDNPRTVAAVLNAVLEAMRFLRLRPRAAAKTYAIQSSKEVSAREIEVIIGDPDIRFSPTPRHIMTFANFMHRSGAITEPPADWRDVFFTAVHGEDGS